MSLAIPWTARLSVAARFRGAWRRAAGLRIGTRLVLAFLVVISLTSALGLFAMTQLGSVKKVSNDITEKWTTGARLSSQMNTDQSDFRIAEAQHMLSTEPEERARYAKELATVGSAMDKAQADYAKLVSSPEEKALFDEFKRERRRYLDEHTKVIRLSDGGHTEDAKQLFRYNSQQKYDRAAVALKRLVDYNVAGGQAASARSEKTYAMARVGILGAMAVAVVLGVLLAVLITRSITKPIREALRVADAVARGDLTVQTPVDRRDEAGLMLRALHTMTLELTRLVGEVRQGSEAIAVSSREIAVGNLDLSQRTEMQASRLQQIVAAISQLDASVRTNADSAQRAKALADQTSRLAREGRGVVVDVVQTMDEITKSSRKIGDVTSIINDIAFQTNILALNAAVEAARAGDAGSGFGVVAAEVRNLAQRSASAAKQIRELIQASVSKVEAGSRRVNDAGLAMDEIVAEVLRVDEVVGSISAASGEQAAGIAAVRKAVTALDEATQQNSALVEQSAAASEALKQQAQGLVQSVAVFKTA